MKESAHEESEFSDSGSRAGAETTQQDGEEEAATDEAFGKKSIRQMAVRSVWND
jgi:hypothetical protein